MTAANSGSRSNGEINKIPPMKYNSYWVWSIFVRACLFQIVLPVRIYEFFVRPVITCAIGHSYNRGDMLQIGDKAYEVTRIISSTTFSYRRTWKDRIRSMCSFMRG